jgi:hypothetical protein
VATKSLDGVTNRVVSGEDVASTRKGRLGVGVEVDELLG